MLLALAALVPYLATLPQEPVDEALAPDPELVARTVRRLEEALDGEAEEPQLAALRAAREVPHADVVRVVAPLLVGREPELRTAATQCLRWLRHPDAAEALIDVLRSRRGPERTPAERQALVKALGQHGDPRAIEALARGAFRSRAEEERGVIDARLYALGRIRADEALEALMELLRRTDPRHLARHMTAMRTSLTMLTGVDRGRDPGSWQEWWSSRHRTFEVAPEEPPVPVDLRRRWNDYWGLATSEAPRTRREERGRG